MSIIPETRPTTFAPVKIARPGTFVTANQASQRWAAASAGLLAERGLSLEQISRMSGARRGTEARSTRWRRSPGARPTSSRMTSSALGAAPLRLWEKRTEIPGLLLEKGANLFMKNGKQPDA